MTTAQPSLANNSAVARPMPRPAPVTKATGGVIGLPHDYNAVMSRHLISVVEAKRSLSKLLRRVAYRGESIGITKRGRPVARLVPVNSRRRTSLAKVRGWLDDDEPFFAALDQISAARHVRRPRSVASTRRHR